jgi:hypothetical protein
MVRSSLQPYIVMSVLISVLLVITAGVGLWIEGLYSPFLSETLVAFQFFQDLLSLLFAPLLLVVIFFAHRGSLRAFVIWVGLLVYTIYYYAFYCFGFVYTNVYSLYLALMGLAAYSLIGLLTSVDLQFFRQHVSDKMPVRLISGVLGMTVLFTPIWLGMLVQGIKTQQVGTTDLVFVLDLPFLIPACTFAAVQIWRRQPLGYLLSGPLLFKATISGVLLTGGEFLKMQRGLPPAYDQLAMYLFLATVGSIGFVQYMRNLQMEPSTIARRITYSAGGL